MNKICLALVAFSLLFVLSCNKDGKTLYGKYINGVNLTNEMGTPVGSIGVPDEKPAINGMNMVIFPTPCSNLMEIYVSSDKGKSLKLTATIVNVIYKNAPKTWNSVATGQSMNVNVENDALAGTIALTQTKTATVDTAQTGIQSLNENTTFNFDVSTLPQGFYQVYIETDDGRQIWKNAWILR